MKISIKRREASQELCDFLEQRFKNMKYFSSAIFIEEGQEPFTINHRGTFLGVRFVPEHEDEFGNQIQPALYVKVNDWNDYYKIGGYCERGDMFARDSRIPGHAKIWYFDNGDEIHWEYDN